MSRSTEFEGLNPEYPLEIKQGVIPRRGRARFFLSTILVGFLGVACFIPGGIGITPTPAEENNEIRFSALTVEYPRTGISLQAACNPDNTIDLRLKVDEDKLHLATSDKRKGIDGSWVVITNRGSGERAIIEAAEGKAIGSWSGTFPGRVGSIRPGGGYSESGFDLQSGQTYNLLFYKDVSYTTGQPPLNDPITEASFRLDCH